MFFYLQDSETSEIGRLKFGPILDYLVTVNFALIDVLVVHEELVLGHPNELIDLLL